MPTVKTKPAPEKKAAPSIDLATLADQLDVPAAEFTAFAEELVGALRRTSIRIEGFDLEDAADDRSRLHTRAKEQVLARCYEFLRLRTTEALTAAGVDTADRSEVELSSDVVLEELGRSRKTRAAAFARRCLTELSELRDLYVSRIAYLVPSIVHKYLGVGVDRDDLHQEAYLGLLRAIEGYDWRRGVRFSTYAKYWVQDRVLKTIYDQSRTVRLPAWVQKLWQKATRVQAEEGSAGLESAELAGKLDISERRLRRVVESRKAHVSLDAPVSEEEGGSYADLIADERTQDVRFASDEASLGTALREVIDELPEREARVLERRFGLGGSLPESLQQIGSDLGLSAERVRQIQQAALAKLRGLGRITALRDCLA